IRDRVSYPSPPPHCHVLLSLLDTLPPCTILFPYTTLFRSRNDRIFQSISVKIYFSNSSWVSKPLLLYCMSSDDFNASKSISSHKTNVSNTYLLPLTLSIIYI